MSKIKDILTKDYGNTNFKTLFKKIPEEFFNKASVILASCMLLSLVAEELIYIPFHLSIYFHLFTLFGFSSVIFGFLYIGKLLTDTSDEGFFKTLKYHLWDVFLFALLCWSFLCAFLATDKSVAFTGTAYRNDGLSTYFVYFGMYVCGKLASSDKIRRWFMKLITIIMSLLSLVTIPQALGNSLNVTAAFCKKTSFLYKYASIYSNSNHFAYFLTMGIMSCAGLFVLEEKCSKKSLWLVLYTFNVWALVINDTFGCYLAVLFGLVFLLLLNFLYKGDKSVSVNSNADNNTPGSASWKATNSTKRVRILSSVLLLVIFMIVSFGTNIFTGAVAKNYSTTYGDAKTIQTNNHGGSGRIGLWKQALKYIKESPVTGYGPEGLYQKYYDDGFDNDRPHNEYIQDACFLGLPGLALYLAALISLLCSCLKNINKLKPELLMIGALVFAYCVSAFFGNTMYNTTPYYFLFLGMLSEYYATKKA